MQSLCRQKQALNGNYWFFVTMIQSMKAINRFIASAIMTSLKNNEFMHKICQQKYQKGIYRIDFTNLSFQQSLISLLQYFQPLNKIIKKPKINQIYYQIDFIINQEIMQGGRSVKEISKRANMREDSQRIVSGRGRVRGNQDSNQTQIESILNAEEGEKDIKEKGEEPEEDEDQFEFQGIDIMPVRGDLNSLKQEGFVRDNQISGRKTPKDLLKNFPRFSEPQNISQNNEIDKISSLQSHENSLNNQNSHQLSLKTQQQANRQPLQQTKPQNNNVKINQQLLQSNNQLTESSLNAFLPTDYTKDKGLSYAKILQKQINRKNKLLPQLPQPQSEQNIRETVTINNLFSDEFFAGRLSFVWLFIIGKASHELIAKIQQVYRPITDRDYEMPFCRTTKEALQFFKAQNCYFKVIVDLDNVEQIIKSKELEKKILSIYLFNNDPMNGLKRAIRLKASSKKIRQCYNDLSPLLKRAQKDIQNGNKFVKQKQGTITEVKFRSSLPTFIKLNHQDKSQITAYRVNLYGAIKLTDQEQRRQKLDDFTRLVKRVYFKDKTQMNYLTEYLNQIDHETCDPNNEAKHFAVLRFYVQETFYYKLTNNMLRVCRTIEEFKPLTVPFNENYHAIKYFYDKTVAVNKQKQREMPSYQLYRGATLKQMDFYQLKYGDYIELLGFVSTSKNEQYTKQNFIRREEDYLFIFNINTRDIPDNLRSFDHGYVDLSQYNIATTQFQLEEQVLLNALNIYRVTKVLTPQQSPDNIGRVFLQYGAIFDLYEKQQDQLTNAEKSVLANYRFCIKEMNEIEDHGDVLMKTEEYDKCKEFYQNKIKHQEKVEYYNKLAQAHFYCGQTDDARNNAIKSLIKYQEQLKNHAIIDQQRSSKIFQIHEKNIQILIEKEDSLNAKKAIDFEIQLIDQSIDWILKAQKLMKRGQIQLKQGNLIDSQKDLKQSQTIILDKKNRFQLLRDRIHSKYFLRNLCRCFFTKQNTLEQKIQELERVDEAQREMLKISDKVHQLLLNINDCFMTVAEIVGDKKSYEEFVRKGRLYFKEMPKKQDVNVFETAKIKVIEAKVQNAFQQTQNIEKSYDLMEEAIQMIKKIDKNHEKVGEYSDLLGKFHKKELKKTMILPTASEKQKSVRSVRQLPLIPTRRVVPQESHYIQRQQNQLHEEPTIQTFNQAEYKQRYLETKQNFQQALAVITYHKTENHPKVFEIRNNIGEVEYEYSNFRQGKEQASMVLRTEGGPKHSEGAKSALLIAKTHLSQGEIKEAFENVMRSHQILRIALVKDDNDPRYQEILILSPIYMQIQLYKCKIYNRQMQNDLALTSIKNLRAIGKKKLRDADGVGYLADIYEEMGNILVCQGDTIKFQKYYEKAISLRQHEMGKNNILNAICYCTMAKYLIFTNDMETAEIYLSEAFEIFSRFAYNHPYFWIQLSTMAYLSQQMNDRENQLKELRESVRLIEKRYSKNHINLMKMKLRFAEVLMRNEKYGEALPIYEMLERQMEGDLSLSKGELKENVEESQLDVKVTDNQKVAIRYQVKKSLKQTQLKISNSQGLKRSKQNGGSRTELIVSSETPDKLNQNPETDSTKAKITLTPVMDIFNPSNNPNLISEFNPDSSNNDLLVEQ